MIVLVEESKPGDAQTIPTRQEAPKSEQESTMENIRHTTQLYFGRETRMRELL
jgi:hypothetical protein